MKPVWLISLLLMNVLWAAAYSLFKVLAPVLDAGTLTTLRFGLATLLMLGLWRWWRGLAPRGFDLMRTAIMGVLVFCVAPRLQVSGVQLGKAGDAAILMAFDPVIVAVAAAIFLREHLGGRSWAGFALGLTGVAVLAEFWRPDFQWPNLTANALILASFACESTYTIAGKPLVQRADPIKVLTCSLVAGSGVNLALNARSVARAVPQLDAIQWLAIAYLVIPCTVVGYLLWFLAVRETPVNLVASTVFMQPLAGVIFALVLVNEEPRWSQLGGAVCIARNRPNRSKDNTMKLARRSPSSRPSPQEKVNHPPVSGGADALGCGAAFSTNDETAAMTRGTSNLLGDGDSLTLSPGERAGVRAGQTTNMGLAERGLFRFNQGVPKEAACETARPGCCLKGKPMKQKLLQAMVVLLASIGTLTQVSSGSNGAFHPTTKTVIHPPRHL